MYMLTALVIAILIARSNAASVQNDEMQCKPLGEPLKIFSATPHGEGHAFKIANGLVKNEKYFRLVTDSLTRDEFQFFNCTKPNDKFSYFFSPDEGEDYTGFYGQLRSVDMKDHCVTAGGAWSWESYFGGGGSQEAVKEKSAITVQPCATKASETLRRQWFQSMDADNPKRLVRLSQQGYESDEMLGHLVNKNGFSVLTGDGRQSTDPYMYLAHEIRDAIKHARNRSV